MRTLKTNKPKRRLRAHAASGSALCPWVVQKNGAKKAERIASAVGCSVGLKTTQEKVDCLKSRKAADINEAIRQFRSWLFNPFTPLGVSIDKFSKNPFLTEHPYELMRKGKVNDVPIIFSVTEDEGLYPSADFLVTQSRLDYLNQNWSMVAAPILHYQDTIEENEFPGLAQKIRMFYMNNDPIAKNTFKQFNKILSDRLYIAYCEAAARMQAAAIKSPVLFYYFNFHEKKSKLKILFTEKEDRLGLVAHGDDYMYILSNPRQDENPKFTKNEIAMKEFLLNIWTSFAQTGKPTNIKQWTPVAAKSDDFNHLYIKSSTEYEMRIVKELGNRLFWKGIPFKENENLYKPKRSEL